MVNSHWYQQTHTFNIQGSKYSISDVHSPLSKHNVGCSNGSEIPALTERVTLEIDVCTINAWNMTQCLMLYVKCGSRGGIGGPDPPWKIKTLSRLFSGRQAWTPPENNSWIRACTSLLYVTVNHISIMTFPRLNMYYAIKMKGLAQWHKTYVSLGLWTATP